MPVAAERPVEALPVALQDLYGDFPVARTAGGTPYVNVADEYVAWLSFANAGMLNKGNLLAFDYACRHLPSADGAVVEVGAFCGLSTNLLAHYLRKHGAANPMFNCDAWRFEGAEGGGTVGESDLTHAEYRQHVRASYKYNVQTFSRGRVPSTVELASDDFFAAWAESRTVKDVFGREAILGRPIALAYIDGDHTYAQSRRDFENVDRFLQPGGFVLFDDSADGSHWEVTRVVAEVKGRSDYRQVVKNPNYLFQKIR